MRAQRDKDSIIAAVCTYLCKGYRAAQIADLVCAEYGDAVVNRQTVYDYIEMAGRSGWLHFASPPDGILAAKIREQNPWLHVTVAGTAAIDDVANRSADTIMNFLNRYAGKECSIGFSGGHTMRLTVQRIAKKLAEPAGDLPKRITFLSLSGGFDSGAAGSDATAFFTYLNDPSIQRQVEVEFVLLHAPPIIRPKQRDEMLREIPAIAFARAQVEHLDLIVTSAASFKDPHSMLKSYLEKYSTVNADLDKTLDMLETAKGDMLWLPFDERGPIDTSLHPYRTMTLIELGELPRLIAQKTRVLLVVGPCAALENCKHSKANILKIILAIEPHLITDLVVDYKTAWQLGGGSGCFI
jgi:DNA-binding transcriptional regulator LsrR (DeoR family)